MSDTNPGIPAPMPWDSNSADHTPAPDPFTPRFTRSYRHLDWYVQDIVDVPVEPIRNQALFDQVAHQFEVHPETYNQEFWAPRKWSWHRMRKVQQGCIATWAAVLGNRLQFPRDSQGRSWPIVGLPGEATHSPFREARDALGLTHQEAMILFAKSWEPPAGQTVPEALRAIGRGADILPGR